jgi:hypothetical protein
MTWRQYVNVLIEAENPIDEVWKILTEIWKPEDNLTSYFKRERSASAFESWLNSVFYEVYDLIHRNARIIPHRLSLPIIVLDGMSVREGNLLVNDLESRGFKVLKYTYGFSSLPSVTESFRESLSLREFVEIEHGKLPSDLDFRLPIWISFPDEILHHAGKLIPPDEAYERTRDILFRVLDKFDGGIIRIASDHGYVLLDEVWRIGDADMRLLKSIYGSKRFVKRQDLSEDALAKLRVMPKDRGYVFMDDEYCYVKGRYFWPVSGYGHVAIHGGLSIMECLVPLIEVRV